MRARVPHHWLHPAPGQLHPVVPVGGEQEDLPQAAVTGQQGGGPFEHRHQADPGVRRLQGLFSERHQ